MSDDEIIEPADLDMAVDDLSTVPGFRSEMRGPVYVHLQRMCPHKRALRFTVDIAVARWKRWMGISELRAILCTRFDPADKIDEPNCSTPGLTAEDSEARYLEQHVAPLKRLPETTSDKAFAEQIQSAASRLDMGVRR